MEVGNTQASRSVSNAGQPPKTPMHICLRLSDDMESVIQQSDFDIDLARTQSVCYKTGKDFTTVPQQCAMTQNGVAITEGGASILLNGTHCVQLPLTPNMVVGITGEWVNGYTRGVITLVKKIADKTSYYHGTLTLTASECHFEGSQSPEQLTSAQLSINTSGLRLSNGDLPSVDYTATLSKKTPLTLFLFEFPCVLVNDKLAVIEDVNRYKFCDGDYIIKAGSAVRIVGQYAKGIPDGQFEIQVSDGRSIHNYLGTMRITDGQCQFICAEQLSDGDFKISHSSVMRTELTSDGVRRERPLIGHAKLKIDDALIEGKWTNGQPMGDMRSVKVADNDTIIYKAPMRIIDQKIKCHGQGIKEVHTPSGKIYVYKGNWDKGEMVGKAESWFILPLAENTERQANGSERAAGLGGSRDVLIIYNDIKDAKTFFAKEAIATKTPTEKEQGRPDGIVETKRYKGQARGNKPHGSGEMRWADGNTYQGEFKDGLQDGEGVAKRPNGDLFKGTFVAGKRAHGVLQWANGDRYEGEFKVDHAGNDKRGGTGSYTFADGKKISGLWEGGELKQRDYEDKRSYTGGFDNRYEPNGKGKFSWSDGRTCEGTWKAGKLVGDATVIIPGHYQYSGPVDDNLNPHNPQPSAKGKTWKWVNNAWSRQPVAGRWEQGVFQPAHMPASSKFVATLETKKQSTSNAAIPETSSTAQLSMQENSAPAPLQQVTSATTPAKGQLKNYRGLGKYDGPLKNNLPTGTGKITDAHQVVYEGMWDDHGQPIGEFSITYPKSKIKYVGHVEMVDKPADQTTNTKGRHQPSHQKTQVSVIQPQGSGVIYSINAQGLGHDEICKGEWEHGASRQLAYTSELALESSVIVSTTFLLNGLCTIKCSATRTCQGTWENGKPVGNATLTFSDGSTYVGPVNDRYKPHGDDGVMRLTDGRTVKGEWGNGKLNLKNVTLTLPDGSVYVGPVDKQYQPIGKKFEFKLADGRVVEGQSLHGALDLTKVKVTMTDGTVMSGAVDAHYNFLDGDIELVLLDRRIIRGQWSNGALDLSKVWMRLGNRFEYRGPVDAQYQPVGDQIELTSDGRIIKGNSINGVLDLNYVSETPPDKSHVYVGPMNAMRQRDGEGVLTLADGTRVSGVWFNGVLDIQNVTVIFKDNSVYVGSITPLDGQYRPHGKGKLVVSRLNTYDGEFKAGKYDGDGEMRSITGDRYVGKFTKGGPADKEGTQQKDGTFYQNIDGTNSRPILGLSEEKIPNFDALLKHAVCGNSPKVK